MVVGRLVSKAKAALQQAQNQAWNLQKDDHWCGEIRANVTVTAEHLKLYASLGRSPPGGHEPFQRYILSQQNKDGSWGLATQYPGDVSTSCEAYFALRLCDVSSEEICMQKARTFILDAGGIPKVRIFTRLFLAMFGIVSWKDVPLLPPELILLPNWFPLNIYKLASWARSTIVPPLLIRHHEPVFPLPGSRGPWLNELWPDPSDHSMPYTKSFVQLWKAGLISIAFGIGDRVLSWIGGLRYLGLQSIARQRCVKWIIQHQEPQGDWAGIAMPMLCGIQALMLEGFPVDGPKICGGLAALERFGIEDEQGKRIQACISPHWDTVLMMTALCDASPDFCPPKKLEATSRWLLSRQQLGSEGDWRVWRPKVEAGGFSFEYHNAWYPDVDDTAATIIALFKYNPTSVAMPAIIKAVEWILGLQNDDGGWAAFDSDNNSLWLNKIPFSDMNALCDPSTADITGRVLEAFGLILNTCRTPSSTLDMLDRIAIACNKAISFLTREQMPDGSWWGRWGCNYLYGTSGALCGLEYFAAERDDVRDMIECAVSWIRSRQNRDGGWGECLMSYTDRRLAGYGPSTPSQTAWALIGLMTSVMTDDEHVMSGIDYLTRTQVSAEGPNTATWREVAYTGTGFPGHFYFGYDMYRHYFPMMALGRFLRCSTDDVQSVDSGVGGV